MAVCELSTKYRTVDLPDAVTILTTSLAVLKYSMTGRVEHNSQPTSLFTEELGGTVVN